jgi:predicted transcriptional regulator
MRASEIAVPNIGINVKSDGNISYADLIIDGKKKYETRNTNSLKPYVGKRVSIVRTGRGKAVAIGSVVIGEPIEVDEDTFRKYEKAHLVPAGSKFDIVTNGTKFLYPMIDPKRYDTPKQVAGLGIISRKLEV